MGHGTGSSKGRCNDVPGHARTMLETVQCDHPPRPHPAPHLPPATPPHRRSMNLNRIGQQGHHGAEQPFRRVIRAPCRRRAVAQLGGSARAYEVQGRSHSVRTMHHPARFSLPSMRGCLYWAVATASSIDQPFRGGLAAPGELRRDGPGRGLPGRRSWWWPLGSLSGRVHVVVFVVAADPDLGRVPLVAAEGGAVEEAVVSDHEFEPAGGR